MEATLFTFQNFNFVKPVSKISSERQMVLKEFVDEINKERIGTTWKPITGKAVAMKLSHVKSLQDLYYFLSNCRDYKARNGNFSKCFFGSLKVVAEK